MVTNLNTNRSRRRASRGSSPNKSTQHHRTKSLQQQDVGEISTLVIINATRTTNKSSENGISVHIRKHLFKIRNLNPAIIAFNQTFQTKKLLRFVIFNNKNENEIKRKSRNWNLTEKRWREERWVPNEKFRVCRNYWRRREELEKSIWPFSALSKVTKNMENSEDFTRVLFPFSLCKTNNMNIIIRSLILLFITLLNLDSVV